MKTLYDEEKQGLSKKRIKIIFFLAILLILSGCGSSVNSNNPNDSIKDTTPPTITLIGEHNITIIKDEPYIEKGALAFDIRDGNLTNLIKITGTVDTHILGTYTLNYSISDTAGNESNTTKVIHVVLPVDTTPPTITLIDEHNITIINVINKAVVRKTGQTIEHSAFDDGYYQKGIDNNYTRDPINETVTDHLAKLMWQDNSEVRRSVNKKPWITKAHYDSKDYNNTSGDTAKGYCDNLIMGEYSDWRLPTPKEMSLLLDETVTNEENEYKPTIHPIFENCIASSYWTDQHVYKKKYAWWLNFDTRLVNKKSRLDEAEKFDRLFIRCVRNLD